MRTAITHVRVLPLHVRYLWSNAARSFLNATRGMKAKVLILGGGAAFFMFGAEMTDAIVEWAALVALLAFAAWIAFGMLERPVRLFVLSFRRFPLSDVAPARVTLARLGLDAATIARVQAELDAGREVRLASFDQGNRIVSDVGPIPYFGADQIPREAFKRRVRHVVDLVAVDGVIAVRKTYQSWVSIENEGTALHALAKVRGVPRIVRIDWARKVMYQSFLLGENVGSLMAARGVSISMQHQVATSRPPKGTWSEVTVNSDARREAVRVLAEVVPEGFIEKLAQLVLDVHEAGVTLGDIKYGNVLLQDGDPVLCDFDWSRVMGRRGIAMMDLRREERDIFNYTFGTALPLRVTIQPQLERLFIRRPELERPAVDYGGGFRAGLEWTLEHGTGRWIAIRGFLPSLRGRRVLDLGTQDPIVLMQILRAGASSVATHQPDADSAMFADACHAIVELVDNRRYDFSLSSRSITEGIPADPRADLVLALDAFDDVSKEQAAAILAALPAGTRHLVVQPTHADRLPWDELLATIGFALDARRTPFGATHELLVASRRTPA